MLFEGGKVEIKAKFYIILLFLNKYVIMKNPSIQNDRILDFLNGEVKTSTIWKYSINDGIEILKEHRIREYNKSGSRTKTINFNKNGVKELEQISEFDSAFLFFPAYQYKITVFSNDGKRSFYGYNYLILDSSNWEYEMSKTGELGYFHSDWSK